MEHSQFGLVFIVVGVLVYFYPAWTAFTRKPDNFMGVFVLNLFLGWTAIGWLIALIWAFSGPNERRKRRLERLAERKRMRMEARGE
ncbi:superinfection immunity protein [Aquabacter cavernae]|uniref:superinfection immunity protein n=1 Tax=Aquabacter cavernae TaxID=2496029 RepID=UPI000F8E42C7